jgi:hypothetical protein
MTQRTARTARQLRTHSRTRRGVGLAVGLIAVGVLAAGCGSSPPARTGARRPGAQALAFSKCMRSHGVSDFPDPKISSSGGGIGVSLGVPQGVTQSPAFKTAQQACAKLAPGGTGDGGAAPVTAQQHRQIVQFAACVRAHGVPDFPDPDAAGTFHLVNIDTNSPAFTTATQKCQVNGMPLNLSSQQGSGPQ